MISSTVQVILTRLKQQGNLPERNIIIDNRPTGHFKLGYAKTNDERNTFVRNELQH